MSTATLTLATPKKAPAERVDPLLARARRNYPDDEYLQREWMRAVALVRKTKRGWVLDDHLRQGR